MLLLKYSPDIFLEECRFKSGACNNKLQVVLRDHLKLYYIIKYIVKFYKYNIN